MEKITICNEIYEIMEKANNLGWPEYAEHRLNSRGDMLALGYDKTNKHRTAALFSFEPNAQRNVRTLFSFDIKIPEEFPVRWFANRYAISREYGGPEEGGWYFDRQTPMTSRLCISEEHANAVVAAWQEDIDKLDQDKDLSGVNSTGYDIVVVENYTAQNEPTPRYE